MPCLERPTITASDPVWFIEAAGERSGPHSWSIIVELVRVGGLAAHDHLWRPGLPISARVDDFSDLEVLLGKAPSRPPSDVDVAPNSEGGSRNDTDAASEPANRHAGADDNTRASRNSVVGAATIEAVPCTPRNIAALLIGAAWVILAAIYGYMTVADWPNILDGALIARLQVFGALGLVGTAFIVLPSLWGALRTSSGEWAGIVRVVAAGSAIVVIALTLMFLVNGRSLIQIAFGADPMGRPDIHTTSDGQLEVRGPLAAGTAQLVADRLSNQTVKVIHLNSPGGWIREGMLLADLIKEHGLQTDSRTGCYSACILAYLAGSPRMLHPEARLGFHSVSGEGVDPFYLQHLNAEFTNRLVALRATEDFVKQAVTTSAKDLWMPDIATLRANHLISYAVTYGYSDSGERLREFDVSVLQVQAAYPFVSRLESVDPVQYAELDQSLRLAYRRLAPKADFQGLLRQVANEIEVKRLPYVSDATAYNVAQHLLQASAQFAEKQPIQCVAILAIGPDIMKNRSEDALIAASEVPNILLTADTSAKPADPAASRAARDAVMQRANVLDPQRFQLLLNPQARDFRDACETLSWLFKVALSADVSTTAGFLRTLRFESPTRG
jgi:hypothetical protein